MEKSTGWGAWKVDRDDNGYACGISIDGFRILQLIPGTERNEDKAQEVVDVLNLNSPSKPPIVEADGEKGPVGENPCDHCPTLTSCNRMTVPCREYYEREAKFRGGK